MVNKIIREDANINIDCENITPHDMKLLLEIIQDAIACVSEDSETFYEITVKTFSKTTMGVK